MTSPAKTGQGVAELICPFCNEDGFDASGLKHHLLAGWCETFDSTPELGEFFMPTTPRVSP